MSIEPHYIVVDQKTFTKEDLVLDNHVYKNCQLDHCRVFYSGGPFELIDTHITNSELVLNQPAPESPISIRQDIIPPRRSAHPHGFFISCPSETLAFPQRTVISDVLKT